MEGGRKGEREGSVSRGERVRRGTKSKVGVKKRKAKNKRVLREGRKYKVEGER